MAKRSRGAARPGQMRPTRRPARPGDRSGAAAGVDTRRSTAALPLDQAPDADVDLSLPVEASARTRGDRSRTETLSTVRPRAAQPSSLLAQRAAREYEYVARDVRHISVVAGGLVIVLAILWVLIDLTHVITF